MSAHVCAVRMYMCVYVCAHVCARTRVAEVEVCDLLAEENGEKQPAIMETHQQTVTGRQTIQVNKQKQMFKSNNQKQPAHDCARNGKACARVRRSTGVVREVCARVRKVCA